MERVSKKITYTPSQDVCSKLIEVELEGDIVKSVVFTKGCPGNTMGISRLVEGKRVCDVVEMLGGIDCRGRGTSCPDQLSKALSEG